MNADWIAGQQFACFCVLAILIVSFFAERQRGQFNAMMLCASVLNLSAIVVSFANRAYAYSGAERLFRVSGGVSLALTGAAGAVTAGSLLYWKPSRQTVSRWLTLAVALIPVWLAGLGWIFTRETALFPAAETLSLLTVFVFYRGNEEAVLKERAEEIENHQAMLFQWQMHPHFLFNTLGTIRELLDSNPSLAASGLDNLAGYLRKNLDALALNRMIPFTQELEHIEQYVALEKMNPANRFEVVYDLQIIDFALPALSVQPLVENAIRHGVRDLGEEGAVFVVTERHGDMIRIIVEDNGPGFPEAATQQQKEHISHGLENVRRRLQTQCGGSLHIHSGGDGTRLIVLIPKNV